MLKLPKGNWNYFNNCTAGNGKLYLYWSTYSDATGYQIRYATNSKFTGAKTVTVKGYKNVSKTISKLSSKKTYYVQVRTYQKVSGKNYTSNWSATSKVKTK